MMHMLQKEHVIGNIIAANMDKVESYKGEKAQLLGIDVAGWWKRWRVKQTLVGFYHMVYALNNFR